MRPTGAEQRVPASHARERPQSPRRCLAPNLQPAFTGAIDIVTRSAAAPRGEPALVHAGCRSAGADLLLRACRSRPCRAIMNSTSGSRGRHARTSDRPSRALTCCTPAIPSSGRARVNWLNGMFASATLRF